MAIKNKSAHGALREPCAKFAFRRVLGASDGPGVATYPRRGLWTGSQSANQREDSPKRVMGREGKNPPEAPKPTNLHARQIPTRLTATHPRVLTGYPDFDFRIVPSLVAIRRGNFVFLHSKISGQRSTCCMTVSETLADSVIDRSRSVQCQAFIFVFD